MPREKSPPRGPEGPSADLEAERYYQQFLQDQAFWEAHRVVGNALRSAPEEQPTRKQLEAASRQLCGFAMSTNDRAAWAFVFQRFRDFVDAGRTPPKAMLECVAALLSGFPDSFLGVLSKPRRGRPPPTVAERAWEHTNLALFEHYRAALARTAGHGSLADLNQRAAIAVEELRTAKAVPVEGSPRFAKGRPRGRPSGAVSAATVLKLAKRAGIAGPVDDE